MDDVRAGRAAGFAGLQQWLRGPECRALVRDRAELAQALYRDTVAKKSGALARSARVFTTMGGASGDRWVGKLTVEAPYAAAHEFGRSYESRLRGLSGRGGAHDLETTLRSLGRL